jgi:hypothetical protein
MVVSFFEEIKFHQRTTLSLYQIRKNFKHKLFKPTLASFVWTKRFQLCFFLVHICVHVQNVPEIWINVRCVEGISKVMSVRFCLDRCCGLYVLSRLV